MAQCSLVPPHIRWLQDRIKGQARFDGLRDMVVFRSTISADHVSALKSDAMWASERAQERYGLDAAKGVCG
jgi:hypothetical protein